MTARLGRLLLAGIGLFFIGMAVLQAWPGRGFWPGTLHGQPASLAGMVQSMACTPQPHFLSTLLVGFDAFDASHGFAVNLVVVVALAAMGAVFLTGRPRLVRYAVWFGLVFCLADWVLVQDFGFLGGLGTDPNSMIPLDPAVLGGLPRARPAPDAGGSRADAGAARDPGLASAPAGRDAADAGRDGRGGQRPVVGAVGALAIILVGAAPMAAAAANRDRGSDPGPGHRGQQCPEDYPAPSFQLTDQNGQPVSLASLRGKVVLMTFLDPVCTTDCPIIGAEFKEAGGAARPARRGTGAVLANPTYRTAARRPSTGRKG